MELESLDLIDFPYTVPIWQRRTYFSVKQPQFDDLIRPNSESRSSAVNSLSNIEFGTTISRNNVMRIDKLINTFNTLPITAAGKLEMIRQIVNVVFRGI